MKHSVCPLYFSPMVPGDEAKRLTRLATLSVVNLNAATLLEAASNYRGDVIDQKPIDLAMHGNR